MTDPEKVALRGSEYSPLNHLSSGDEVEQFALPVYLNSLERPKRRRKRRDFNALKTKAISTAKQHGASCSCYKCFTVILFLVIIASLCGLGFTYVTLSQNVHELHKSLSDLQEGKTSSDSELIKLKSDFADLDARITASADTVEKSSKSLIQLNSTLSSIQHQLASLSAPQDHDGSNGREVAGLKDQMATFGSDMDTVKSDVSTLKQTDASQTVQMNTLNQKVDQIFTGESASVSPDSTLEGSPLITQLESRVERLNSTLKTQFSGVGDLLTKTGLQYESQMAAVTNLRETVQSRFAELQTAIEILQNQTFNSSLALPAEHEDLNKGETTLMDRVDQLETFIHQVSQQLQDDIVSQTDNRIVNLTVTAGIEDFMTRAFDAKFLNMKHSLDELRSSVSRNTNQLTTLDRNYLNLTRSVFDMRHQITLFSNPETNLTALGTSATSSVISTTQTESSASSMSSEPSNKPEPSTSNKKTLSTDNIKPTTTDSARSSEPTVLSPVLSSKPNLTES